MSRRFKKNDPQRLKIANRIKEIVNERYREESDFLREFNIAPGTYGWIKKGKITIEFLLEFSEIFGVNLNWLLRGVGTKLLPPKEAKEPTN